MVFLPNPSTSSVDKISHNRDRKKFFDLWTRHDSNEIIFYLGLSFARRSGQHAEALLGFINARDVGSLCNYNIDYDNDTSSISELIAVRSCLALFQKNDDFDIGVNPEEVAVLKFIECEAKCKETNEEYFARGHRFAITDSDECVLFYARRKIADILGEVPSLSSLKLGFGPGASSTVKIKTTARHKLQSVPSCSGELFPHLQSVMGEVPIWQFLSKGKVNISTGILQIVPKNAKTGRPIIIEPLLNTFVQKGIGSFLKDRLAAHNVDLRNQTINREMARRGSRDGSLATIDMSSASDLIAFSVLLDLLPTCWVDFLAKYRTGVVQSEKYDFKLKLNKFSSMGNGFTFELESLIFYGIAYGVAVSLGCSTSDINVFGDDIICPSNMYDKLVEYLELLGFEVNTKKSYSSGPFRESCGGDYYCGTNIRPFYVKGRLTWARLFALMNHSCRETGVLTDEDMLHLLNLIPKSILLFGPDGYGDGHLLLDNSSVPYRPVLKRVNEDRFWFTPNRENWLIQFSGVERGWSTHSFKTWIKTPLVDKTPLPIGDDLFSAYSIYDRYGIRDDIQDIIDDYLTDRDRNHLHFLAKSDAPSRDNDPYVIRGGWKGKRIRVLHFL